MANPFIARMKIVGRKKAHAYLASCRRRAAETSVEMLDLSFVADFDWRGYVCQHAMAQEIVGSGIWKLEGRFINTLEPNRGSMRLPPPFGNQRFDFIALRTDGSAVRMHPSEKADAKPIFGSLEHWRMGNVRASTPGAENAARPGTFSFNVLGRVDVVSNERALVRAMELYRTAVHVRGSMDAWNCDLSSGDEFPWDRWLMGRPFGADLVLETVSSMSMSFHQGSFRIKVTTLAEAAPRFIRLSAAGSCMES